MKATKYIAALALLAGFMTSCQQEWTPKDNGDTITVEVSVQLPEPMPVPTKAKMAEGPTLDEFNLYLCLYGSGAGYIQNWIPTVLQNTQTDANGYITGGTFLVELPKTSEQRTIHFFVNPPADMVPSTSMYIDELMQKMITVKGTDDECSYWQQITLSRIQDPVTVQNQIGNVHLVRNYAKIIVSGPDNSDNTKITVNQWTLINVPKRGYVAPYTGNTSARFPSGYLQIQNHSGVGVLYNQLVETDNYPGYMPALEDGETSVIDSSFPGNPGSAPAGTYVGDGQPLYMYERPVPTSTDKQTSVLVQVTFGSQHAKTALRGKTYWYKVEVVDQEGEYVPFLRDVVYRMNVENLEVAGYSSAQEAYNKEYFGNISASLETASLNDISNGKASIHVDKMDYTFFAGEQTVILNPETGANFYFIPDTSTGNAYTDTNTGACTITLTVRPVSGYDPAIVGNAVNVSGAGVIQVDLAEMGTSVKKSIVRVTGKVANSSTTLYRDIVVNLMGTQDFVHGSDATRVVSTPDGLNGTQKPVNIEICLPEGLGSSVFPIQVRIETEANSLYALTPDLPVSHGPSVFASKAGENSYFMVYTINYSNYCQLNSSNEYTYTYKFPITLYTNKRGDNNHTTIDIRDLGGCFNPMQLTI